MNPEQLKSLVIDAVAALYRLDGDLIRRGLHEVTMAHRLAVYLEQLLRLHGNKESCVDLEYNRNMDDQKRLAPNEDGKRPDIIIHRRESNAHNLLIVEMKKNAPLTIGGDEDRKLRGATNPHHAFRFVLGVYLNVGVEPSMVWYANGTSLDAVHD